jgi:hypothetical protein
MSNIIAFNTIIPLTADSLYCQPRVALITPSNNTYRSTSSNNVYYIVLVDLPQNANYPAPTNAPIIQADGSIYYPYTLADGSPLPDIPPPGVPLVTYVLPVYGCNPIATENGDYIYFPPVYFAKVDNIHKGIVKSPKGVTLPADTYYEAYQCEPFVVRSVTLPSQLFAGTLVFLNERDICTAWASGTSQQVQLLVQKANPPSSYNSSFQGFYAGTLQPTNPNGFQSVTVVFTPDYAPSGQAPSQFSYTSAQMITV